MSNHCDIPPGNDKNVAILNKIQEAIQSFPDIRIVGTESLQNMERYTFVHDNSIIVVIDIFYSKKRNRFTKIMSNNIEPIANSIRERLESELIGQPVDLPQIPCKSLAFEDTCISADDEFLVDNHNYLINKFLDIPPKIVKVECFQYRLRYTISDGKEVAVFDLQYNANGQFKHYEPLGQEHCTSKEFTNSILKVIYDNEGYEE